MTRTTAKPAHTPGPWTVDGTGMGIFTAHGDLGFRPMVASTAMANVSLKEARANARLIAEAPELPELLELLIYLRDCTESGDWPTTERWAQVQAVIKKVTGEAA